LGITRWFVATGEGRESQKEEFHFLLGLVESFRSFLVRYDWAWEMTAFPLSPSFCGWQAVQVCICDSLVSLVALVLLSILCSFWHIWPPV
jgi:hypothetical protein